MIKGLIFLFLGRWGGGGLMTMEGYSTARSRTCRSSKDFSPVSPFAPVLKFFLFFYIFFVKGGRWKRGR